MAHVLPVALKSRPWTRLLAMALIVAVAIMIVLVINGAWLVNGFQWDPEAAKTWLSPLCGGFTPPDCG